MRAHVAPMPATGRAALVAAMAAALPLPKHDVYVAGPAPFVDAAAAALGRRRRSAGAAASRRSV